ncbi:MAG TPA: 50S ribosomal protein L23 [Candidatus Saccharimonadales bacterium]|nr:50S ribosomal protein L23 [Candidatus Saccharimonadales bacterium]
MSNPIALKPRLSEKAYGLSEERNTYIFEVPKEANRHDVAKAIAKQYGVAVKSVRIAAQPGKTKRKYLRKGRVTHRGFISPVRKAYVRLKEGDKLPIFAAVEDANKAEDK